MSCSCGKAGHGFVSILDISAVRQSAIKARSVVANATEERIVRLGDHIAHASAIDNGKQGCFTISFLGIPVQLCWEITDFEVTETNVNVKIKITVSTLGQQFLSKLIVFHCDGLLKPDTCTIQVQDPELKLVASFGIGCDWGCLKDCAPACISCGTDYWCWAGCAGACALRCCHL